MQDIVPCLILALPKMAVVFKLQVYLVDETLPYQIDHSLLVTLFESSLHYRLCLYLFLGK